MRLFTYSLQNPCKNILYHHNSVQYSMQNTNWARNRRDPNSLVTFSSSTDAFIADLSVTMIYPCLSFNYVEGDAGRRAFE